MDKLAKLPPKDLKSLKDHPIAQGVISNTIFQIVSNGLYFMIAWLVRHYALIYGIPPFVAILLAVFAFFLISLSVNLLRRRKEAKALNAASVEALESASPATLPPEKPKPKLDFEIDESESSVSAIRGGSHVSRITADINLRCEKETDRLMVVRSFHLSLHRLDADGKVTLIPYQQEAQVIWESSKGKLVPFKEGWTIDKPRSDFRHYSLTIEITPQAQKELSPDHFLGLTMDAIGQDLVSKTIHVKDWTEDNSPISLKPFEVFPPAAQKEISELKGKLRDYKATNEKLGRFNERYTWLIKLADTQKAEIDEHVSFSEINFCYIDQLSPKLYRVVFALWVTNNSHLDISLEDELEGIIKFEGVELLEKKRIISPLRDAPQGSRRSATIEQRLSDNEYQTVMDAHNNMGQAYFQFDDLIVNIVGGKRSPSIDRKSLKIPKNTNATAFPLTVVQRGLRVKALSQVWGRCVQLAEPLRIATDDKPLDKNVIENWRSGALYIFEREGYSEEGANRILKEVTGGEVISETSGSAQRNSIYRYISVLEDLISRELKELHNPEPTRRLTHKELVQKIEALPPEERAKAFKYYGLMLEEQQKDELSRNTKKT
jgi:hypothetical protein